VLSRAIRQPVERCRGFFPAGAHQACEGIAVCNPVSRNRRSRFRFHQQATKRHYIWQIAERDPIPRGLLLRGQKNATLRTSLRITGSKPIVHHYARNGGSLNPKRNGGLKAVKNGAPTDHNRRKLKQARSTPPSSTMRTDFACSTRKSNLCVVSEF